MSEGKRTTRNFADVIRAEMAADPELAKAVHEETIIGNIFQRVYDDLAAEFEEAKEEARGEGYACAEAVIAELRRDLKTERQFRNGEYWKYQGDGEDHLESLTCPVMIEPKDLIAALNAAKVKAHGGMSEGKSMTAEETFACRKLCIGDEQWLSLIRPLIDAARADVEALRRDLSIAADWMTVAENVAKALGCPVVDECDPKYFCERVVQACEALRRENDLLRELT